MGGVRTPDDGNRFQCSTNGPPEPTNGHAEPTNGDTRLALYFTRVIHIIRVIPAIQTRSLP